MSAISNNPASTASASLVVDANRTQVQSAQAPAKTEATAPVQSSLTQGESVQLETYQVKKGDTLWDIADFKLGDPMKWKQIHALNKEQIKNPDLIYPGQTLTLPKEIQVAPTPPPTNIPSPVDSDPAPAPAPAPVEPTPAPAEPPAPPVAEEPVLPPVADEPEPTPAQPPANDKPLLRPPSELPFPEPKLPNVADPKPTPAPAEPTAPVVSEPATPPVAEEPATPAPAQPTPDSPPLSSIGQPTAKSSSGIGKAAVIGGVVGTVGTGATLIAMTRSAGNLGGYQTAQVVAKGVNSVIGKVGLEVPTGPALSKAIKKIGGPKVAGSVTAVTAGLVVAGVAAGSYAIYHKATSKEGTVASLQSEQKPQQTPEPATVPAGPVAVDAEGVFGNVQPVVDMSPLKDQLAGLLDDKKYVLFGAPSQPEEIRGTAVQIWEQGGLSDKVEMSQALVEKGQSEVLGRILTHQSVDAAATAELMSAPGFPVEKFMNDISDNHAFVVLDKLAGLSANQGDANAAKLLTQVADAYDGTFSDREKPFNQLRQQYQATGSWAQLPANVTQSIDKLLK